MTDHAKGDNPTTAHDQLMNRIYRNQRFIYDASRKYYLLGRDKLIDGLDVPPQGRVLEVACGTGRNLIKAGRRYPDAQLYGFDISSEMLITARANLARAGMADRVHLAQGDATDFSARELFNVADFDRVFISYSLSMIPDWQAALGRALSQTAPGGQVSVVDFGQQTGLPGWFGRGLTGWLAKFHVQARADLPALLDTLAKGAGTQATVTRLFRDYAVMGTITRPG